MGETHDPLDRLVGVVPHDVDAIARDAGVVGKADHGDIGARGDRPHDAGVLRQQGAKDQAVALGQGAVRRGCGAGRGVIGGDADLVGPGVHQRQCGRVGDRLAHRGIGAAHRYQQRDAVAQRIGRQPLGHIRAGRTCRAGRGDGGRSLGHDRLTGGEQQRARGKHNARAAFQRSEQVRLPGGIRLCHLASLWKHNHRVLNLGFISLLGRSATLVTLPRARRRCCGWPMSSPWRIRG